MIGKDGFDSIDMTTQNPAQDVSDSVIIREASDVLEAVGVSGVMLPDNWRWPLADELNGIAACMEERARELQQAQVVGEWFIGKPTEPGVYRVRGFHVGHSKNSAVVEVEDFDGDLCCNLHEVNSSHNDDRWSSLAGMSDRFEWQRIDTPQSSAPVGGDLSRAPIAEGGGLAVCAEHGIDQSPGCTHCESLSRQGGEPVCWDYQVRDEPQYGGDSMRETTYDAEQAEILRKRGYVVRPLFTRASEAGDSP